MQTPTRSQADADALLNAVIAKHCLKAPPPPKIKAADVDIDALGLDLAQLDEAVAAFAEEEKALDSKLLGLREASAAAAAAELPGLRARGVKLAETRDALDALAEELAESSRAASASSAALRAAHESRERVT